jgi:endonuclease YncB( thermonuclease family)
VKKYALIFGLLWLVYPPIGGIVVHGVSDLLAGATTGQSMDTVRNWGKKALATPGGQKLDHAVAGKTQTLTGAPKAKGAVPKVTQVATDQATIAAVNTGDTLTLTDGSTIRLAQVQAPRAGEQCYGRLSTRTLKGLVHPGDKVTLGTDPALPGKDAAGHLIRYVWDGTIFLNARALVVGAAAVRFEDTLRGEYATRFERYGHEARAAQVGLWGFCHAAYDPYRDVATGPTR